MDSLRGRCCVAESGSEKNGLDKAANCPREDTKDKEWQTSRGGMVQRCSFCVRLSAIIVLLAHMGSFVPAQEAVVPLTKEIFARMGAADEIIYGRSTFMVEMTQIARILRESDEYSLVVMDEVGRGTAVADGLAIAWAVIKELSMRKHKPFALISTHYPEIAELSADLPVLFLAAQVAETEEGLTFLYRIEQGVSDKAYGLEVAALAGVPPHVLSEASRVFQKLSSQDLFQRPEAKQMRLF